jgi:hypothetical protein
VATLLDNSLLSEIRQENLKVYRSSPQRLREDLDEYADEKAGLIDLINEAKWWLNRQRLGIQVNFAALTQVENSQAAAPLPRKPRV